MSNLSLHQKLPVEEDRERPPPEECDSIFSLPPPYFEAPFPLDPYNYGKKNKPLTSSFYEKMRDLRDANRVFVKLACKPMLKHIDSKCQFEVLNSHGYPIYFGLDTTDAWASTMFEDTKLFNVMILDYDYDEVLRLSGPVHGSVWVKHCGKDVGRITQEDHHCSFTPTYSVKGSNDVVGLMVKGPPNSFAIGMPNKPVFEIQLNDEVMMVLGHIKKDWLLFGRDKDGFPEDTYVVDFHQNMDLRSKCLMLSIVFILDYHFYHKTVDSSISRKSWVCFIFLFLFMAVVVWTAIDQIRRFKNDPLQAPEGRNSTSVLDKVDEFNRSGSGFPTNSDSEFDFEG